MTAANAIRKSYVSLHVCAAAVCGSRAQRHCFSGAWRCRRSSKQARRAMSSRLMDEPRIYITSFLRIASNESRVRLRQSEIIDATRKKVGISSSAHFCVESSGLNAFTVVRERGQLMVNTVNSLHTQSHECVVVELANSELHLIVDLSCAQFPLRTLHVQHHPPPRALC